MRGSSEKLRSSNWAMTLTVGPRTGICGFVVLVVGVDVVWKRKGVGEEREANEMCCCVLCVCVCLV